MTKLRLAFMGTPDFSVPALQALHSAGHEIVAVYCQPPKPAGRGQQVKQTPVHKAALDLGLTVLTPRTLRDEAEQQKLRDMNLDIAVVAAYGLILPQAALDAPRMGCINIHGSLLPRWRGAAPIQRSILAGDTETGITIMQMEAGLDTGPMLLKQSTPITTQSTASTVHDALASIGATLVIEALEGLAQGTLKATPQPDEGTTYAAKLTRADGQIDWTKPATEVDCLCRALTPWPGAFFQNGAEAIKVLKAEVVTNQQGPCGALLDDSFTVGCGQQALRLLDVQRAGKKAADGASVLRGMRLELGHLFS